MPGLRYAFESSCNYFIIRKSFKFFVFHCFHLIPLTLAGYQLIQLFHSGLQLHVSMPPGHRFHGKSQESPQFAGYIFRKRILPLTIMRIC